jgi:hypothetical protein
MKDSHTTRMSEIANVRQKTSFSNLKKFERKSRRENGEKVTVHLNYKTDILAGVKC